MITIAQQMDRGVAPDAHFFRRQQEDAPLRFGRARDWRAGVAFGESVVEGPAPAIQRRATRPRIMLGNRGFQHTHEFRQRHGLLAVVMRLVCRLIAGPGADECRVPRHIAGKVAKGAFDRL